MTQTNQDQADTLTRASLTIAWVVIANKPFYPLYVWWLIGEGVATSAVTLVSIPFFLLIPLAARRSNLAARCMLPLIGTVDTLFETMIFGRASATLLFLAPCIALAALSFHPHERWWQRGMVGFVFCSFVIGWLLIDNSAYPWNADQMSILLNINVFAVGSLMGFIGLRYAGVQRRPDQNDG